jgi:hypothetical protein
MSQPTMGATIANCVMGYSGVVFISGVALAIQDCFQMVTISF